PTGPAETNGGRPVCARSIAARRNVSRVEGISRRRGGHRQAGGAKPADRVRLAAALFAGPSANGRSTTRCSLANDDEPVGPTDRSHQHVRRQLESRCRGVAGGTLGSEKPAGSGDSGLRNEPE